jgi:alkylation response protein AidB-like acyl-CoA dehydrogenase
VVLGAIPVLEYGKEDQKQEILPRIAAGDWIMTMAITEPKAGYAPAAMEVEAAADGEDYVIQGTKLFVEYAHIADRILCAARTQTREDPEPEKGIGLFVVNSESEGVRNIPLKTIARDKQCEVIFEHVRVPGVQILGGAEQGWPIVRQTLEKAAVARGAEMLGVARGAMDMALAYAKERVQFDRPIGSFQAVQHHFANMWIEIYGCRHLVYKAAAKIAQGRAAGKEAAMVKARTGIACRKVTTLAHQIFGAIGFTMEHDLHFYYRKAVAGDLFFGNSSDHHEELAGALGL